MNMHSAKILANILVCFILSKDKRRNARVSLKSALTREILPLFDIIKNQILNNKIIIIDSNGTEHKFLGLNGLKIRFRGKNSKAILHTPIIFSNSNLCIGSNSTVEIKSSKNRIENLNIFTWDSSSITIDNDFSCAGCNMTSNSIISIGKDCQFSCGINIMTSDAHTIYDIRSHTPINTPFRGISIGNHVWVGMHSTILKNVSIADNSIVGANSLVTKSYDFANVILAGSPAKIVKENINWERENKTPNFI